MKDKHKKNNKSEASSLDFSDEIKRLNRITGQIDGIQRMLESGRKLADILTQCKAVHSALASIESRVFKIHLLAALDDVAKLDKKKSREEIAESLEELFKQSV